MTNELEKQFFDTFGIEFNLDENAYFTGTIGYPQITDRIYLMLLATLTCISSIEFPFSDIQKLKEDILKEVIKHQYGFDKHQVRTLFEDGKMEVEKLYNLDILRIANKFNKTLIYNSKIWEVTYFNAKGTPKTATLTVDRFFKALRKYHKSIHGDYTKPLIHIETESR